MKVSLIDIAVDNNCKSVATRFQTCWLKHRLRYIRMYLYCYNIRFHFATAMTLYDIVIVYSYIYRHVVLI